VEYPHWLEVTEDDPVELSFYNNTGLTVIQDFSIWIFECALDHWPIVQRYLRGLYNLFSFLGGLPTPLDVKTVKELLKGKEVARW